MKQQGTIQTCGAALETMKAYSAVPARMQVVVFPFSADGVVYDNPFCRCRALTMPVSHPCRVAFLVVGIDSGQRTASEISFPWLCTFF